MKYFRQKRINLTGLDSRWGDDCFILVSTQGFMQVQDNAKKFRKLSYNLEKYELKQNRLKKKLEDLGDEDFDKSIKDLDELEEKVEKASTDLFELMIQIVRTNFISGQIFDSETSSRREMKKEDIEIFDTEILQQVTNGILGNLEKKG